MSDIDLVSDIASGELDSGNASVPYVDNSPVQAPPGTVRTGSDVPAAPEPKAAPAAEKPANIRDQLSAAFAKSNDDPAADGRARNPDGTFAPKPGDPPADQQVLTPQVPVGMPTELAPHFTSLPPEMQQMLARTFEHVNAQAQQFGEYSQIEQVIGPRRELWARDGATPAAVVQQLFNLSDFAGNDPKSFVLWFSEQHKLDLDAVLDERDAAAANPDYAKLLRENEELRRGQSGNTQNAEQQALEQRRQAVATFATEKDGAGQPLRPYWTELEATIAPLVQAVRQQNPSMSVPDVLSEAYNRACYADPAVRGKITAAEEANRLAAERVRTGRAKAAASSVTGAPSSTPSTSSNSGARSIREMLTDGFASSSN